MVRKAQCTRGCCCPSMPLNRSGPPDRDPEDSQMYGSQIRWCCRQAAGAKVAARHVCGRAHQGYACMVPEICC